MAVAVAITAATLKSFITFGLPILRNAVGKDMRADVESISRHLDYIRASFVDHFQSSVAASSSSYVEDRWLKDMNLLAYAIEDLIDCFITKTPLDVVDSEAAGFLSPAWRYAKRMVKPRSRQIGKKIRQLKQRSEEAHASLETFGVKKPSEDAPTASTQDEAAAATHVSKEHELLQHLLGAPSEPEKKLTVISIVGYGALGNTLLVDNVYNANQVQNRFARRTRYNAAGKEAGLVIKEISAQVTPNQNGGSAAAVTKHQEIEGKAVAKHHKTESSSVKDLKGKAVMEDEETENASLAVCSASSSQKDGR